MNLDNLLIKSVTRARKSFIGKRLFSFSSKIGSPSTLAVMNIVLTAILGFIVTYPIYLVGGFWAALPTGLFTILVVSTLSISFISERMGYRSHFQRKLLVFSIVFSMPFGVLSIPLLHKISENKKEKELLKTESG